MEYDEIIKLINSYILNGNARYDIISRINKMDIKLNNIEKFMNYVKNNIDNISYLDYAFNINYIISYILHKQLTNDEVYDIMIKFQKSEGMDDGCLLVEKI